MKKSIFITLFLFSLLSFGQKLTDKELIEKSIEFLRVNEKDLLIEKATLKTYQNDKIIIVLPILTNRDNECDYCYDIDNNILVWDKKSKSFEANYTKKSEWTSDAVYLSSLKIDTAPYYLNKNIRAFGLRYSYSGSSRVNPYDSEIINLYYLKDNKIIEVLSNLEIEKTTGENNGTCENASFETSKSILIMNDQFEDKLNDISIKTKIKNYSLDSECDKEIVKSESIKYETLIFNEKEKKYVLQHRL
ncbi:PA3715 family protein [Aestuariibaculum lutulentum]|uniref:Uncharacterized protein n=1 Tax=Aestuariibaculum lutulentum TaxID=2920935 RepID=A0ABS9RIX9_9FLAO|nr:hypothetical protein [Aestuariibaculum lutulentum]MCH4552908.1 hypothetical protein [Aestuariibaculum lutulentum]